MDGSNGLAQIRVVTKTTDEVFNEQPNPDRWFYEIQNLTKLILSDDYDAIYRRLGIMEKVMGVLESSRKKAGVLFSGE